MQADGLALDLVRCLIEAHLKPGEGLPAHALLSGNCNAIRNWTQYEKAVRDAAANGWVETRLDGKWVILTEAGASVAGEA